MYMLGRESGQFGESVYFEFSTWLFLMVSDDADWHTTHTAVRSTVDNWYFWNQGFHCLNRARL